MGMNINLSMYYPFRTLKGIQPPLCQKRPPPPTQFNFKKNPHLLKTFFFLKNLFFIIGLKIFLCNPKTLEKVYKLYVKQG